jgi:hypothetical protein
MNAARTPWQSSWMPLVRALGRRWMTAWMTVPTVIMAWAASIPATCGAAPVDEAAVSFRHDVMPILSKAGCNGGGCHGALAGKGGFRMSLFGYNPEADHLAITREAQGRRVELAQPGLSLLLTKPTTTVRHKGGKRLETDSDDYRTLARWIAQGAPGPLAGEAGLQGLVIEPGERPVTVGDTLSLKVVARYGDGRERDVTRWCKFTSTDETVASVDGDGKVTVLGPGVGAITAWYSSRIVIARLTAPYPGEVPEAVYAAAPRSGSIDTLVLDQLRRLHLPPSPPADDATVLRRASLDTLGRLPTPAEVDAFLADTSPDRHSRLVDRLLNAPEYVDFWAYKWSDVLLVSGARLRPAAVQAYYGWIRARVADNTPWDRFVRQVVTARGSSVDEGESNFFAIHQDPESMAENVSQAFLSLSINCARCHNHPLEKWTNDQYYQFANLFARVRAKGWGGDPRNGDGRRQVYVEASGDLIQPRTGRAQPPAPLDARPIEPSDPRDRREVLADWLTSPDNPYFARAIANRIWAHFLGVGLVESVDDLRASNPASNERLLSALADHLVTHRFDLKSLMREILVSRTYRRSSEILPGNRDDRRHYSRFYPRRLPAEVLSDAIADVTGVRDRFTELTLSDGSTEKTAFYTNSTRSVQLFDSAVNSYFLKTFGRNQREITCECERSNQPSLVQALHLSNGGTVNDKLRSSEGRLARLLADGADADRLISEAYRLALSRPPRPEERRGLLRAFADAGPGQRSAVAEDLFWAILTGREFLFQH